MITQLRVKNFKSWANTGNLRIAPLTGFFGTNSSGKTSLLQVLLMLKQTTESSDRSQPLRIGDKDSIVDLGTFDDIIHGHALDNSLELSFTWNLKDSLIINNPETEDNVLYEISSMAFESTIRGIEKPINIDHFMYTFDGHRFGIRQQSSSGKYELETSDYRARRVQGRAWPLSPPVRFYGFPDEAIGYYQNTGFLPSFAFELEQLFASISYLGPLREYPQRSYLWGRERPLDVGRKGEQAVAALLAARDANLTFTYVPKGKRNRKNMPIEERIGFWLKEMGLIHSFTLTPVASNRRDYEFRIKKTPKSSEVLITDVGFGVSQVLPVLVLCYYVPENSVIILEQPEIHLHPSVQSVLADVLIEVVKERKVQIIFESHSEHLLHRLRRRIAEETLSPDETALYFCSMGETASQIEELQLDDYGNIRNWPKDFFGDESGDLVAQAEAEMQRKIQYDQMALNL